ncbi:MAG: flagellar biosynthesis protein FlhA [SAR324 cluster bacterium]|nr:flagellar biosynthesis protein FlhA [SAR324 cluster bacterium]
MAASQTKLSVGRLTRNSDLLLAAGVIGILLIMVLPLPELMIDLLLAMSITLAVLILFVALFTTTALDFSSFPTILLISTLFRLSLNVASTRLILLNGNQGPNAAGSVIKAFGEFVAGGNQIVGIIIFLILVLINFVVITKGAGRIAEVAARFTLDAMPGKQMAIDADLNAGLVDEQQAKERRTLVQRESDFYGAMDGASKFVRGDSIAGLIISAINIIGGLLVGTTQFGMSAADAFGTYAILTIGDGLVSQIPALIISVGAGIVVTKASAENKLSIDLQKQMFNNVQALFVASMVLLAFAMVPGLPTVPFLMLSLATGALAYSAKQHNQRVTQEEQLQVAQEEQQKIDEEPEDIASLLPIDMFGLELGYGLIPLVDEEQDGELLKRVKSIRRQVALDFGFIVPPMHIKDNLELAPGEYSITIKGIEVGRSELMVGQYMAMKTGDVDEEIAGVDTVEPAFGLPAMWISPEDEERAQFAGYTVVDIPTVLATHITEILKSQAYEFLGRQETQRLLDNFAQNEPKVVEELIPNLLPLGAAQKVLQNLLREQVSIRDLHTILETLADMAPLTKDPDLLTEYVRQSMSRPITRQYQTADGLLPLTTMSQEIEDQIAQAIQDTGHGTYLGLDPELAQAIINKTEGLMEMFAINSYQPILLCSPLIRPHVKRLTERFIPNLVVLSHNEISPDVRIESLGIVE